MKTITNWFLLLLSLALLAVWCLVLIPLLRVSPLFAYCISLPLGLGATFSLAMLWRES